MEFHGSTLPCSLQADSSLECPSPLTPTDRDCLIFCRPGEDIGARRIEQALREFLFKRGDPCLYDLVAKLLRIEPKQRLNSNEILEHPFFLDDR